MKKLIPYILTLGLAFSLGSCDVEVVNPNTITSGTFWKTETDAQYGLDAVYNMFYKSDTYSRWLYFRFDLTSDEGFSSSPWAELGEWTRFQYYNYNFGEGNDWIYDACYRAIFRANQVLANVPDIPFANEDNKKHILAQAHLLRGLYYYNLALLWGSERKSLAIVLSPSTPEMKPEGHTGTEVYQQAIDDYTKALEYGLPDEWNAANKGRVTKGAALALRAKAYMQMHRFAEAKSDLTWLVTGEGKQYYDLMPNYIDNFTTDAENNKESVFEMQFTDINPATQGEGDFAVNPMMGLNRGQFFAPPETGWADGELRPWLVTEFKKEKDKNGGYDTRLKYSALYPGMHNDFPDNRIIFGMDVDTVWTRWGGTHRVFFRKYARVWQDHEDYANPINVRWIRYADVLLMYAECVAQTDGPLSEAVAQVNRVRARVDMPELAVNHPAAAQTKEAFLKRLEMERVMELATEGHRWEDIIRYGLLDSQAGIDELKSRDEDFNNFTIGKHNVLPIPSDEKNNNPNIEQNPGY